MTRNTAQEQAANCLHLVDVDNLYFAIKSKYRGRKLQFEKYVVAVPSDWRVAYCRQTPKECPQFFNRLMALKFEVSFGQSSCSVLMALRAADLVTSYHTLVLGTANEGSLDLIKWAKDKGKRVKCFACQIPSSFAQYAECLEIGEELLDDPSTLA